MVVLPKIIITGLVMLKHWFSGHSTAVSEQRHSLFPSWPVIEIRVASANVDASLAALLFSKLSIPFGCFKFFVYVFVTHNTLKILNQIKLSTHALI